MIHYRQSSLTAFSFWTRQDHGQVLDQTSSNFREPRNVDPGSGEHLGTSL